VAEEYVECFWHLRCWRSGMGNSVEDGCLASATHTRRWCWFRYPNRRFDLGIRQRGGLPRCAYTADHQEPAREVMRGLVVALLHAELVGQCHVRCGGTSLFAASIRPSSTLTSHQIIFHSQERDYILTNLPWLIGSLGTMVEDITIFIQFRVFGNGDASSALEA
jgi:hypothetical protein